MFAITARTLFRTNCVYGRSFSTTRAMASASGVSVVVTSTEDGGKLEVVPQEPISTVDAGSVLVQAHYASVNFIDTYHRNGLYKVDLPFPLGKEGGGVVTAVGSDVTSLAVGDKVAYCMVDGAYSDQVVMPAHRACKLPDGVDIKTGAAIMLQGLTAHYLAHDSYRIQEGDTVLVHAGAGGMGQALTQICKIRGATVITTTSTEEKAAISRDAGADHVILYTQDDFEAEVLKITDGEGVAAVYDGVGAATFDKGLNCLRVCGTMVTFGNASGPVPPVAPLTLLQKGSLSLTRPSLAHFIRTPEVYASRVNDLFTWLNDGRLRLVTPPITFPLASAAEAHELLESRKSVGKILLETSAAAATEE